METQVKKSNDVLIVSCAAGGAWPRPLAHDSSAVLDALLASADETQRSVVGYPAANHSVWRGATGMARHQGTMARYTPRSSL